MAVGVLEVLQGLNVVYAGGDLCACAGLKWASPTAWVDSCLGSGQLPG